MAFRSLTVSVYGHFGLWPFFAAVSICGRFCVWPFRFVAVSVLVMSECGRYDLSLDWIYLETHRPLAQITSGCSEKRKLLFFPKPYVWSNSKGREITIWNKHFHFTIWVCSISINAFSFNKGLRHQQAPPPPPLTHAKTTSESPPTLLEARWLSPMPQAARARCILVIIPGYDFYYDWIKTTILWIYVQYTRIQTVIFF